MKNEKLPLTFILVVFCLIAINIAIQQPAPNDFQMTEIKLTRFNESGFNLLINDHRPNRQYITTIYANDELQLTTTLKNGTNKVALNSTGKIKIKIYDPENEFNGYGSKPNQWILTYTT